MPRRSARSDDVTDSLVGAGTGEGDEHGSTRRNPRRGGDKPPAMYQEESPDAVIVDDDDDEDVVMDDENINDDDDDDDEPLVEDATSSSEEDERQEQAVQKSRRRKRKSPRNNSDDNPTSPPRKSLRSTKFTSSMAEPTDSQGFVQEEPHGEASDSGKKKKKPAVANKNNNNNNNKDKSTPTKDHHKSPARRHARKRLSLQPGGESQDSSSDRDKDNYDDNDDDNNDNDDDSHEYGYDSQAAEEEEPVKMQRVIASRTERRKKWREICQGYNTSEISDGSRWFQDYIDDDDDEADDTFEERFLIKWTDLSFLHCSWESRKDLIDQVEGAKTYLSTFFRKSQDGYLYGPDERNDGDYFDPAFTQVDRILEILWPDDVKKTDADEEAALKPEDVGVVMDKENEEGTGRQFLIKWSNLGYSEATYEFERDLIWREVDYKPHVEAFLRRNKKPSKRARREAVTQGKEELQKLNDIFRGGEDRTDEEHQEKIKQFQQDLQNIEFKNGGQLRDYQAEGVSWMLANYVHDRSSILADEMGLGKTLQTVVTINTISTKVSPSGVFLVVAPLSTLAHWQREFESWTELNTIIYHGSADDRDQIRKYEMAYECDRPSRVAFNSAYLKKCGPKKYNKLDSPWMIQVIITTPEMLTADDANELMAIKYDMIIVDEAHRMKNRNSKLTSVLRDEKFTFHMKLLLTGTPIQNDVSEFWTLLNFCDEKSYDDLDEFLEKYGDMKDKETVDQLHEEIRPYILRRLKEDVEKSVPPKEEVLIEVELTMPQKQYYRALYEKNVKFLYKNKSKALDGPSLNNLAMQLRKCCNHVCLLNGVEGELRRENPELSEADFLVKGSGKLVLLDKLLPRLREEGHRVLLFSQFKIMLDLIEDYLIARGMKMERIDGSITGQKRQQAIDRFQAKNFPKGSEPPFIMLLSTRAGGQGITLTAADTCIIFDSDWNPQNDLQAQARCHRIGQESEVKVYRLISAKSYEMQMFHLSSLKMGLDQAVLKGFEKGGANDGGMSKEEVERLLKHGAYDILNEEKAGTAEAASNEFIKQDIDSILAGRSRKVVHENTGSQSDAAGGTFSKASFQMTKTPGKEKADGVEVDDPNFWSKILGEKHLKESEEDRALAKRQRNQTNYNEAAYQKQLDAVLLSDDDSDSDSDGEGDGAHAAAGKVGWGVKNPNDWSLPQAEAFVDTLMAFGYGNLEWPVLISRLGLKDKTKDEIKRMAFSMIVSCVVEATETESTTMKKREDKTAAKSNDDAAGGNNASSGENKAAPMTDKEIEEASLKKFWDASSEWTDRILMDVVSYAKDHEARDYDTLMELLHKKPEAINKEDIKILFAKNVWASLRSRGWKATGLDGTSAQQHYTYEDEKYETIDEVLKAARKNHSELSEVIDSVENAVKSGRERSVEAQAEKRQHVLDLVPSNVSLENLRSVIELYAPPQLIADRRKSHSKVKLTRKLLSSCSLMTSAFNILKKAESLFESGTAVEKISQCLQVDRRSSLPHPKWAPHHDAVLLYAITKHGWIESESSIRAITGDKEIVWGPPFDRSSTHIKATNEKIVPPAMIEAVAKRACGFLNDNKQLLNISKTFNQSGLVRTYWLEKHRPAERGDSLADAATPHNHDEDFVVNRQALLQEESSDSSELSELPTRKELVKRAKTILSRATVSAGKSGTDDIISKSKDHPYTVLDQSHPCNVFLGQLIRGMLRAPAGGELYKLLYEKTLEEAKARSADLSMFSPSSTRPDTTEQQRKDFESIIEHIDTVKRNMSRSVRLAKNVLRAIIGEEPQQPKTPNEPLYPVTKARLKVAPVKPKQGSSTKSPKSASKKVDPKASSADTAITTARQRMGVNKGKHGLTVDLTEVETLILQTAATYGLPSLSEDWKTEVDPSSPIENESKMTWVLFGRHLMTVTKARLDEASVMVQKANKDYDGLELKPSISAQKRDAIERACWLAEQTFEAVELSAGQAADYSSEPETLAKKTVMTLAKMCKHAGQKKHDEDVGVRVYKWLPNQVIQKWAKELELLDEHGRTLTLTAIDFLKDLTEAERNSIQTVAAFDSECSGQVVSQVALISRLKAFFEAHKDDPDSLQAHVEQAALNVRENWADRPEWWSAENADFDMLLLKRLANEGFVGLMQSKLSYGLAEAQAKLTYKSLALQRKTLQARVAQLVRSVHDVEEQQAPPQTFFATSATGKATSTSKVATSQAFDVSSVTKKQKVSME